MPYFSKKKICSTSLEAESEASAAALQELQLGCLGIAVMDVSRSRCKDIEQSCYKILANASEVYHAIKLALADWEEDMNKADDQYRMPKNHIDITADVADQLANLTRATYLRQKELEAKAEEVKVRIDQAHERIEYFFYDLSTYEVTASISSTVKTKGLM
jgi:hypothetical protein